VADFDSIIVLGTKTIVLAPDAFGPCFQRRTDHLVRPDFGFDRRAPDVRRIVSLVPGSAAADAGLRDGDIVTAPLGNDVLLSKDARELQLDILRAGQSLHIEYATKPVLVDVYLWSRVTGVAEDVCRG
jgi:predicted metalloprotease with PDZ domain